MQLKLVVLAVRYACNEIGLQWRQRQQLASFERRQAAATVTSV